jgi:hypothetical protein
MKATTHTQKVKNEKCKKQNSWLYPSIPFPLQHSAAGVVSAFLFCFLLNKNLNNNNIAKVLAFIQPRLGNILVTHSHIPGVLF